MIEKATPIQARIQDSVTSGNRYSPRSDFIFNYVGKVESHTQRLNLTLRAMDEYFPQRDYFEPVIVESADTEIKEDTRKSTEERSLPFAGLVPSGYTAHRSLNGSPTRFVNDETGQQFCR